MHVAAIIAAGGRGLRMGRALPKQYLTVGGQTILERSLAAFDRHQQVQELVVVIPPEALDSAEFVKPATSKPVRFVAGGARRQDSVANGVDALSAEAQVVLVHDAARPCVSAELISRTIAAAASAGAAIAAVPVHDTVKQVTMEGGVGFIEKTLPRETLFLAQTPQGFRRDVLDAVVALGRDAADATDEASLAERAGYRVQVVPGDPDNLKITTEADLARAEGIVGGDCQSSQQGFRDENRPRLRSARARRRASADSRRRADSLRARPDGPFGRRCGQSCGDRRGARRREHRRHRQAVPRYRSGVEGREQPAPAGRRVDARARRRLHAGEPRHRRHRAAAEDRAARRRDPREPGARARRRRRGRSASRARPTSASTPSAAARRSPCTLSRC